MEMALRRRIPVAVTLAGGYAEQFEDTITIHCNTVVAARDCLGDIGWQGASGEAAL